MTKLILFFMILIPGLLKGAEIRAFLETEGTRQEVIEGEIVELKLTIWPISQSNLMEIEAVLAGQKGLESIHTVSIDGVSFSENNAEALEIFFTGVFTEVAHESLIELSTGQVRVELRGFNIIPLENYSGVIEVLSSKLVRQGNLILWVLVATLLCVLLFWTYLILKRISVKKRQMKELQQKRDDLRAILLNSATREDFEKLYNFRSEIVETLSLSNNEVRSFFDAVEKHQYKRDWTEEEFNEVLSEHQQMRSKLL